MSIHSPFSFFFQEIHSNSFKSFLADLFSLTFHSQEKVEEHRTKQKRVVISIHEPHSPHFLFQQINSNGFISFLTEIPNFFNVQFPLEYPIIAPFYSDVDAREAGSIWYRWAQGDILEGEKFAYFQTTWNLWSKQGGLFLYQSESKTLMICLWKDSKEENCKSELCRMKRCDRFTWSHIKEYTNPNGGVFLNLKVLKSSVNQLISRAREMETARMNETEWRNGRDYHILHRRPHKPYDPNEEVCLLHLIGPLKSH